MGRSGDPGSAIESEEGWLCGCRRRHVRDQSHSGTARRRTGFGSGSGASPSPLVHSNHASLKLSVLTASRSTLASIKAPYLSFIILKSRLATHLSMGTNSDSSSPFSLAHMDAAALGSFLSSASSPLYPSTGSSALSETSGLDDSPPSDLSPEHAACASRSSSESPVRTGTSAGRKRVRPKIDLAPGQPPTARGNPRIRVFVACRQW